MCGSDRAGRVPRKRRGESRFVARCPASFMFADGRHGLPRAKAAPDDDALSVFLSNVGVSRD